MKNVRIILALLIVTLLSGSVFADVPSIYGSDGNYKKADTSTLVIPGVGVGWVKIGMKYSFVKRSYGEPDDTQAFDGMKAYRYKKYGIKILTNASGQITSIVTEKNTFSTKKGFTIGSSKQFAYNKLGKNFREQPIVIHEGSQGLKSATYRSWAYPGIVIVWNEPYTKEMLNFEANYSNNSATYNENLRKIRNTEEFIRKTDSQINQLGNLIRRNPNAPDKAKAVAFYNDMIKQRNEAVSYRNSLIKENKALLKKVDKYVESGKIAPVAKYIIVIKK